MSLIQFTRGLRRDVSTGALISALASGGPLGTGSAQASNGPITDTRSGAKSVQPTSSTVAYLTTNQLAVEPQGLLVEGSILNSLLNDPGCVTGWSGNASGTANTATANQTVAPDGTTTGTLITFNTAQTGSTYSSWLFAGSNTAQGNGTYTFSIWLKAGTLSSIPIELEAVGTSTGGNTTVSCALTSNWQRFQVTLNIGGTPGTPGYWAQIGCDSAGFPYPTGTVYAWGGQVEFTPYMTSYAPSTASSGVRNADNVQMSSAGLPTATGNLNITVTPRWNSGVGTIRGILDARNSGTGSSGILLYVYSDDSLVFATSNTSTGSQIQSGVLSWAMNSPYQIQVIWGGGAMSMYRNGSLVASVGSGAVIPASYPASIYLGQNYAQATLLDGWLSNFTVTN